MGSLTPKIRQKYEDLKAQVEHHNYAYHVMDKPEISDFDFDKLFSELLALERAHPELQTLDSPSFRVGGMPLDSFSKVAHRKPMISLANSYSPEDIHEFDTRIKRFLKREQDIEYFAELKFDGLAVELIYENGLLTQALTRGDGVVGEDVTQNVKTIKSIPLRLHTKNPPELFEVRGEILILKKDFQAMNEKQEAAGEMTFANPRNAAAGTVRQLDSKIAASRPLRFFAYALGETSGLDFKLISSQEKIQELFSQYTLPTAGSFSSIKLTRVCANAENAVSFYNDIEKVRSKLPFDIDGIVIKVNDIRLQEDLGLVARSPRWATAAKYKPQQAETVIEDIVVQVGRTGVLTPVAKMKPVKVGGVTVTNSTLHNQEEIDRKDVRIGDSVIIQRAGDVIPEVVSVILDKRPKNSEPFKLPSKCPSCGETVSKSAEEVAYRCINPFCKAIVKESLKHFVARRAMNIDKVGDRLIENFVDQGLVKRFSDLYRLNQKTLLDLERQGEKSVENILNSIEKSKNPTFARLIFALGIRFVGEQTAAALADHFGTVDAFLKAKAEELLQIPDVGPKVAHSIINWIHNEELANEVRELLTVGVSPQQKARVTEGALAGKTFLITGTLPVKRDDAKDLIEKNGGKILGAVSSKLNYLVVGDDPGSKLEKAQGLGVEILNWEDLQRMLI